VKTGGFTRVRRAVLLRFVGMIVLDAAAFGSSVSSQSEPREIIAAILLAVFGLLPAANRLAGRIFSHLTMDGESRRTNEATGSAVA